jgi:hypothetical protein
MASLLGRETRRIGINIPELGRHHIAMPSNRHLDDGEGGTEACVLMSSLTVHCYHGRTLSPITRIRGGLHQQRSPDCTQAIGLGHGTEPARMLWCAVLYLGIHTYIPRG